MKKVLTAMYWVLNILFFTTQAMAGDEPYLVKDIYPGIQGSDIDYLTNVNGTLYFRAQDGLYGVELWKSDGTFDGTIMVKDICSGGGGSYPTCSGSAGQFPTSLASDSGILYFGADDCEHGGELWKSDGTELGTVLVKDIWLGEKGAWPYPSPTGNFNGTAFFPANDGVHETELWKSDGTSEGTVMVKDIKTYKDFYGSNPLSLFNLNGLLYFAADDGTHGRELWKSDGTESGTVMVKDIWPGNNGSTTGINFNIDGTMYLTADDGTHGLELWKSDGTESGTVMVKDIWPGNNGSEPGDLTNINGTLYFLAKDGIHSCELWKSDGTEAGTVMVKDINPSGDGSAGYYTFVNVNGTLYFGAKDVIHGVELWKSDGTEEGTTLVKDISPGNSDSIPYPFSTIPLINIDGTLYFVANDGLHGSELWCLNQPTLITLSSFTATPSERKVIVEWATASEIDNAGFNLYHAESEDGVYVKINPSLIPAEGSPTSDATYKYVDIDVKNRTTYYYKLEDIDLNGKSTVHGSVSATPRILMRQKRNSY